MHLLAVAYDVYELESEHLLYKDPSESDLYITVVAENRAQCLEAVKNKVLEIFESYCQLNITSYIIDKELETNNFTIAHCSKGYTYV